MQASKKKALILFALAAVLTLLMLIPLVRGALVGVFGWAFVLAIALIAFLGVAVLKQLKISAKKLNIALFSLLIFLIICAFHVIFAKELFSENADYIRNPLENYE
ncbi:MAG: hypothetical protein LBN25_01720, partial [Christensenellaceae bacterium]|nr:hypothetical protein [Christensenellaceae bacterium]